MKPARPSSHPFPDWVTRKLFEQYGFVVPGNPFDRLQDLMPSTTGDTVGAVEQCLPKCTHRLRRDHILSAAAVVAASSSGATQGGPTEAGVKLDGQDLGNTHRTRVQAAAASLIQMYGWR